MSKSIGGRFEWHELWTPDAAASMSFYTQIFPWTTQVWDPQSGYSLFVGKNGADAGCHTLGTESAEQVIKPRWNTYISAADVDASVSLAIAHGATVIVTPMDIPRVGRFAMLTDPQGAAFGLLHRNEPFAARPMPPPSGAIVWNELLTSDAEAALKFYSALFGWEQMARIDMGPKGAYLVFGADGVQMGGMMAAAIPGGPLWLPYTQVDNSEATVALAVKAGATLCLGPLTVPGGGRIANFIDPQGVMFAVHSMPPADASPVAAKPAAKRSRATPAAAKRAAAAAPKRKRIKHSGVAKAAKKKRTRPAARKPVHKVAKRRAPPTPRKTSAKRGAARRSPKRAAKRSARAGSKRPARRAKRR